MRTRALLVCLLLVVAGCQGIGGPSGEPTTPVDSTATSTTPENPTTTPDATTTSTVSPTEDIDVEGGSLPYDPNTVWNRVETMRGVSVGPPVEIVVRNLSSASSTPSRFLQLLDVPAPSTAESTEYSGKTDAPYGNRVFLDDRALDAEGGYEVTLAHEYEHVVQMRTGAYESLYTDLGDSRGGVDLWRALVEGPAVYVGSQYTDEYTDQSLTVTGTGYRNLSSTARFFAARYYYGYQYVNETVDSAAGIDAIYENPPQTTEELLHRLPPGGEPVARLNVSVDADREHAVRGQMGELYLRALLGTAVNESLAARTAEGWGNDRQIRVGAGNDSDYAWVLRWDDAANATEFEHGVDAYLDARDVPAAVRVTRASEETTVLFVGSESFVANAEATGENGSVTVRA